MSLIRERYTALSPEHAAAAEEQFAGLKAAQEARAAEKRGPQRSDDWLAEQAVDAAIRGVIIAWIWP